ncbi:MAG TPA: PASTA domain-containing protein [Vicinamibacterales bacterium]|nr:PASTA domain-containing protein [Vicinamibacterales bacterium]
MALRTRVWGAGKILVLAGALLATYLVFAAAAMRVALRTRDVVVPTLSGKTVNEASTVLADAGLTLKVEEGRRVDPKIPEGQILIQEPRAGERTRRQRSVRVWVSAGPRSSIVPALVGESDRLAQMRVQQDGFSVRNVAEIRSADYPAGTVVAQIPSPKTRSDAIGLLINRGERGATYVMPDLIGVNGDRAADLLRARGFRVAVVGDHPYPGVPAGVVLQQAPRAGFQIAPGEAISLEVSR